MNHSKPNITKREAEAAYTAVQTGNLATGVYCTKFEEKFTKMFGYKHVLAVNSGTSALMLALLALGVGEGDEVIVSPYTMVASVNVVLSVGATPVFVDIDPKTYCITAENIEEALTDKTKAVIPVDIFGVPCDAAAIREILPDTVHIVQDTIEALGSLYQGEAVGHHADAGAYGFFPNKQITTGIGGVLFTNDEDLYEKAKALSRHGVKTTVSGGDMRSQGYGFNLRMSDVTAAIGYVQLDRFNEITAKIHKVRDLMDVYFSNWRKQETRETDYCNDFVYVVQVEGVDKDRLIADMADDGIPVKQYFVSLHHLDHLKKYATGSLPNAEKVANETVALPYHHELCLEDIKKIFHTFLRCLHLQGLENDYA